MINPLFTSGIKKLNAHYVNKYILKESDIVALQISLLGTQAGM